ncbi:hypothetical protein NE237_029527 [Protea cynaroides]|uniref:non-specific serine/threonine protein kinase n=1 Tax=Protea cynaroides TaxID=273540 RepID=A0A9Q0GSF9_9MAGN|nr:hypothetical protein NE237_029527 [Protea cynaroides]
MGAEDNQHEPEQEHETPLLDLKTLKVIYVLGRGAKCVIFLVKNEATRENLALKVMLKALIEKKFKDNGDKDIGSPFRRIWFERDVLKSFRHPLPPRLREVVETNKIIGLAIDYCPRKDLNCFRNNQTEKMFSDDIISFEVLKFLGFFFFKFFAVELVLALEYLHGLGIVYRDLKPENVMIQENGQPMLVDFNGEEEEVEVDRCHPRQEEDLRLFYCFEWKFSLSLF